MKNLGIKITVALAIVAVFSINYACESGDDEIQKPYVGSWESAVYPLDSLYEQMRFKFTNNTFEDEIFVGPSADIIVSAITIKGDIVENTEGILSAKITSLVIGGAELSEATKPDEFNAIFKKNLGHRLDKTFDAPYQINGNVMTFTIPIKNPLTGGYVDTPLNLTKQ